MLDGRAIEQKLYNLAGKFKIHMGAKRYPQAKHCYDKAREVAVFVELEEDKMRELFGERKEKGIIVKEGLFKEEQVQKAYFQCCVKAKQEPENCMACLECIKAR